MVAANPLPSGVDDAVPTAIVPSMAVTMVDSGWVPKSAARETVTVRPAGTDTTVSAPAGPALPNGWIVTRTGATPGLNRASSCAPPVGATAAGTTHAREGAAIAPTVAWSPRYSPGGAPPPERLGPWS